MLTNTHILVASALFTRREFSKKQNMVVLFGGIFPDLSIVLMVLFARVTGIGANNLWREPDGLYWQEPWQFFSAVSNSIPLYVFCLLLFMFLRRRESYGRSLWLALALFSATCLSHVLLDFPVHADDAHIHFWPLSDMRFHSPISYWQSQYYGDWVQIVEAVFGIGLAIILWRRFASKIARAGVVLLTLPYLALFVFSIVRAFSSNLGG